MIAKEIESEIVMDARDGSIVAALRYRTADPFAVTVEFRPRKGAPIVWCFARELIAAGLYKASGIGDVQIAPDGPMLRLTLFGSFEVDGVTEFEWLTYRAPRRLVRRFLLESYDLVPAGREPEFLGLDAELAALLSSS